MLWLAVAIIGGAPDAGDPAVVDVIIAGGQCSGVAVAPRVVLTAAHCATPGPGGTAGDATIVDTWIDRYDDGTTDHDLAALRVDRDLPFVSIAAPVIGAVRLIGYGLDEDGARGVKRAVETTITLVNARTLVAGQLGATTCVGDSGGAALDPQGRLVGLISAGDQACTSAAHLVRPDAEPQLAEVIAAWSGTPQDACGFEGTCTAACPEVDLDCPLGGGAGDTCAVATDCESRDCADRTFCSAPCTVDADCPSPLGRCAGHCVYAGATPGIAGAACASDADCRSNLCDLDAAVCTVPCPDGACPSGLACAPVRDTRACTTPGGCNATGGGPPLALLLLLLLRSRRRS